MTNQLNFLHFQYCRKKDLIRGTDVPMLVIFTDFLKGAHNDDFFSRCTSSLIVVCKEETADRIVPPNEKCDFAYTIYVDGNIKKFLQITLNYICENM
jgi:hypothetical protein